MSNKNLTTNKSVSTKVNTSSGRALEITLGSALHLIGELRNDGAHFLSNGVDTFMVIDDEVITIAYFTVDEVDEFLTRRRYFDTEKKHSNTFWGMFLDEVINNESVLLQARLWELGEMQACADATITVSLGDDGRDEVLLDIVKRFGDQLSARR